MECSQADGLEETSMRTQGRRDVGRVALDILVDLEEILCIRRSRDHVLLRVDDEGCLHTVKVFKQKMTTTAQYKSS